MEKFQIIKKIPYEILVHTFLSLEYLPKDARLNPMEEFERVIDVTGSCFLTDEEIFAIENEDKKRLARIESSIPKGMYLSDYPENHPVWAELDAMREKNDANAYRCRAPEHQESFYFKIENMLEKISSHNLGKPIVENVYKGDKQHVQVVVSDGKVFEIDGDNVTVFYDSSKDSEIVSDIFERIDQRILEKAEQEASEK